MKNKIKECKKLESKNVDGYEIEVDYLPTNYITQNQELGNHLAGINNKLGQNVAISVENNILNSGTITFSNSNGISFGLNTDGAVTASFSLEPNPSFNINNNSIRSGTITFINNNTINWDITTTTDGASVSAKLANTIIDQVVFSGLGHRYNLSWSAISSTGSASARTLFAIPFCVTRETNITNVIENVGWFASSFSISTTRKASCFLAIYSLSDINATRWDSIWTKSFGISNVISSQSHSNSIYDETGTYSFSTLTSLNSRVYNMSINANFILSPGTYLFAQMENISGASAAMYVPRGTDIAPAAFGLKIGSNNTNVGNNFKGLSMTLATSNWGITIPVSQSSVTLNIVPYGWCC